MKRPLALGFVIALVIACTATLAMQPACDIPAKTCSGDKVSALASDDGGRSDPRSEACTSCMQDHTCCDLLGTCGEDQTCTAEYKSMHHCMLERGLGQEDKCKLELKSAASQALYQCERKPCGKQCGIPNCDLNSAAPLFATPTCDKCIGSACCEQINKCYENRPCKLFLECVTNHCPHSIGTSMARVGRKDAGEIDNFEAAACGDSGAAPFSAGDFDPGPCLDRCLDEFAPFDAGTINDRAIDPEGKAARCLAISVYTCGARNHCGETCEGVEGVTVGPYPEDLPDAGLKDAATD